jgi:predicted DNA-binding transcriptional regulator AlpA
LEIFPSLPDEALVREPVAAALLGVSRATVWNWVRGGRLAQPVRFGPKATGWRAGDLRKKLAEVA